MALRSDILLFTLQSDQDYGVQDCKLPRPGQTSKFHVSYIIDAMARGVGWETYSGDSPDLAEDRAFYHHQFQPSRRHY